MSESPSAPAPQRRARWRRWLLTLVMLCLVALVGGELFARYYLGLGDPPLSIADPEIEYLFAPSQDVRRFGNRVHYNAWSMRSEDFPKQKTDPRELRVLVFGDSVINGGAQTDQSQLATSILEQRLASALQRPVVVGNISAGSWGPPNLLAYAKRHGLFDADVVVLVLASHDFYDVPTFEPTVGVQPSFPDRKPWLALEEGFARYLLPRLRGGAAAGAGADVPTDKPPEPAQIRESLSAVREMIELSRRHGADVIVAQYPEEREIRDALRPGHAEIQRVAREAGAEVVQLGPAFEQVMERGGKPFRDPVHPSALGQKVIADVLEDVLLQRLKDAAPATEPAAAANPLDRGARGG